MSRRYSWSSSNLCFRSSLLLDPRPFANTFLDSWVCSAHCRPDVFSPVSLGRSTLPEDLPFLILLPQGVLRGYSRGNCTCATRLPFLPIGRRGVSSSNLYRPGSCNHGDRDCARARAYYQIEDVRVRRFFLVSRLCRRAGGALPETATGRGRESANPDNRKYESRCRGAL